MILIGIGTLLIAGFAICPLVFYRLRKANQSVYASVNPDYISKCALQSTFGN